MPIQLQMMGESGILAFFVPKVGHFGHIFWDMDLKFACLSYTLIFRRLLDPNLPYYPIKTTKMAISFSQILIMACFKLGLQKFWAKNQKNPGFLILRGIFFVTPAKKIKNIYRNINYKIKCVVHFWLWKRQFCVIFVFAVKLMFDNNNIISRNLAIII